MAKLRVLDPSARLADNELMLSPGVVKFGKSGIPNGYIKKEIVVLVMDQTC